MFTCTHENCGRQFSRKADLRRHINSSHVNDNSTQKCFLCGQLFQTSDELDQHYQLAHRPTRKFVERESAFRRKFLTLRYNYLDNEVDLHQAQNSLRNTIYRTILREAAQRIACKVSIIFIAEMVMNDHDGERISKGIFPFRSPTFQVNPAWQLQLDTNIRRGFQHQRNSMDEFMRSGSGWTFHRAIAFDIEFANVNPIKAGCDTPFSINAFAQRNNLFNPKRTKNKCFLFCIAYFLLFGIATNKNITTAEEIKIIKETRKFDVKGITFPISINDIKKFLNKNGQLDLKINILFHKFRKTDKGQREEIYPMEYGLGDGKKVVNLLFATSTSGDNHFMLIKNIDNYLKKVYNAGKGKKLSYKKDFFCLNCLNSFSSIRTRDEHTQICCINKPRREQVPDEDRKMVFFKNFEHTHFMDYIAFLDFECILPENSKKCPDCRSLKCKCDCSYTDNINDQLPICYSFIVLGPDDRIVHEHTYSGENAHINFIEHLLAQQGEWIEAVLQTREIMIMTDQDHINFSKATKCYLCRRKFDSSLFKVRDHSHFTSKFLGAACNPCNLRRRKQNFLKIFCHNASRYDLHFIVKAISSFPTLIHDISVLPYNGENFRSLRFNCFEFLDSLAFLQASLAQLSADLKQTDHDYNILKQTYLTKLNKKFCKRRFDMVLEKSFFPYEFCTSLALMKSTKKLPARESFYSLLAEESINDANHAFAKSVWLEFKCKNLLEYTELYCKIDTILLAEIFQAFRRKMKNFSGLDPGYYVSLPAYGYDSMLKITNSNIELPTDIDMVHFLEQGKRGGVSFINTRYLTANEEEKADIIYCDRNNLYGEAQMQKLPYNNFRWLTRPEIEKLDFQNDDFKGQYGYIVECDLKYPKKLHQSHANFPLAPEVLQVNYDNLSPYSKTAIFENEGIERYSDVKLMSTFHDHLNYVTHARNLKLYLSLGMKLIQIHRVLCFQQAYVIAPYIQKTTAARQKAKSKFEMDLFKKLVS